MAKSNDGCAGTVIVGVVFLIAIVPKSVWITLAVVAAGAGLIWLIKRGMLELEKDRAAARERKRAQEAARIAAAKQERIDTMGASNAARVEAAIAAVGQVGASEAARAGWLGEIDFDDDIRAITDGFRKAHALRKVADQLAALANPSADDCKILAEATATIATVERSTIERADLIGRCAVEARRIDDSLLAEREEARTAEQRAELHAKLSGMLYGVEASPNAAVPDSAADAVLVRVAAYREIKNQIHLARDGQP